MVKKKVRTNFIFFNLRKNAISIIFVLFLIGLVVFSKDNLKASKDRAISLGKFSCTCTFTLLYSVRAFIKH